MSAKKKKSWILAILVATVFPAIAFHASCVAVLGPGSWGSGLEERIPEFLPAASNPAVQAYAQEFSGHPEEKPRLDLPEGLDPATLRGTVVWVDALDEAGLWVIQTYDGKNWTEGQRVYLWANSGPQAAERRERANPGTPRLEEIGIGRVRIVERPTLIRQGDTMALVYGRWHSWAIPATEKLTRYARSWLDPELRPEFSLYIYDVESRRSEYFGPGHVLKASPSRRHGAILRSGALRAGYYSIHVWNFASGDVKAVLSLREADEGSGQSFDYRWSADSKALQIKGMTGGFERRKPVPAREFNLIYLDEQQAVYELQEP